MELLRQVATALTVYGIETPVLTSMSLKIPHRVAIALTIYGIETNVLIELLLQEYALLQQFLPFTVCAKGCETAEEQSDDEVRTSQVPEQREGKTKMMKQQYLPFTVLKLRNIYRSADTVFENVATVSTVHGIETL